MNIITIIQVIVSVVLIFLILLQERTSGIGGAFGGGGGGHYQTRRGMEKVIFSGTIFLTVIFTALALINLIF